MKNVVYAFSLIFIYSLLILLFTSCGGGGSDSIITNEYLGDLPSIAKNYITKIEAKKEAIKQNTNKDKVFKLSKELDLLEDEAENSVKDYIANNPINSLPFEQKGENPFTITDVSVHPKYNSSTSRLHLLVKVTMSKDFSDSMFLFIKAVDKEGNQLTKKNGVLATALFGKNSYKANQEVKLSGSIDKTSDLINFEKFIFISKEDYNKTK